MKKNKFIDFLPIISILFIFVVDFSFIVFSHISWNTAMNKYIPLKHQMSVLSNDLSRAHLWLEEAISGDPYVDIEKDVMTPFRQKKFRAYIKNEVWILSDKEDEPFIEELESLKILLDSFYKTAQKRWGDSMKYGIGSSLDQKFDVDFNIIIKKIKTLSLAVDARLLDELKERRSHFILIMTLFFLVNFIVFTMLFMFKRRARQGEDTLFDMNEKAMVTLRSIGDAVVTTGINGNITFINETAEKLTEYLNEEVQGLQIDDVLHLVNIKTGKKIVTPINDVLHQNLSKLIPNGTKLISRSGVEYIISDSAAPIKDRDGDIVGTVLVFQNDTQDHVREQKLHDSNELNKKLNERMELALIGNSDGVWDWNIEDDTVYFSPLWKEMIGYSDDELINEFSNWESRVHPDDLEKTFVGIEENNNAQTDYFAEIYRLKHKDGSWIWILSRGKTQFDENGKAIRMIGTHTNITKEKELQLKFQERGEILDDSINEIFIFNSVDLKFLYVNRSAQKNMGYTEDEMFDMTPVNIKPKTTKEEILDILKPLKEKEKESIYFSTLQQRKDGTQYEADIYIKLTNYEGKEAYVAIILDVTKRKQAERDLETQYNFLHNIIDTVPVRIFWKDTEGIYLGANKLFLKDAKIDSVEELIGKSDFELPWAQSDAQSYRDDDIDVMKNGCVKLNYEELQEGEDRKQMILLTSKIPLYNFEKSVIGVLGSYTDITKQRNIEESLREQKVILDHQAHHDALTGLANRVLFNDRLEHAIAKAKRSGKKLALFFIDLDHFKEINDSLGHTAGDEILKVTTQRLKETVRDKDTIARLGGDEFTIIVEDLENAQDASLLGQKILKVLNKPIDLKHNVLYVSTSIGISIYPDDGGTSSNLLKYADAAMYRAKDEGRNNFQFYSSEMTELALERVVMATKLREALDNQDFIVYYQPQVDARNNSIIGMEALVRWRDENMGLISPAKFIPLAETTGLIVELDQWVMRTAMTQVVKWYEEGLNPGVLAMNLSIKQLREQNFILILDRLMKDTRCKAEWIALEITEGQIMTNPQEAIEVLSQISEMGIELAVDDFGTGYSSLSYLKKLPINKLKIDYSFVKDLPHDEEDAGISKAVIALAKSLKLKIIAEGVEREEQKEFLLSHGCNNIQGYLYAKPMPAEDMKIRLTEGF